MDHVLVGLLFSSLAALGLISAGHALLLKRDPRSALGWIVVCLTLPLFGPLLYWSMGINRISRRARQWLESGQRLAGWGNFSLVRKQQKACSLPPGTEHLQELRSLADRVVIADLLPANRLTPLENAEGAYPAMLEAINSATSTINLSTYIFDGDATGRRFVAALTDAAERGVEVRVIIDSLGEKYSRPTARKLLKGSKVKVGRFLPLRQGGYVNLRNHRKILVVDGKKGFTGGMNIGDRHVTERVGGPAIVKDMHFMVEGQVVNDLQRTFLEDWFFVTGNLINDERFFPAIPAAGDAIVRAVSDGPDKEFRKLNWIIMGALSCARDKVRIMTPYFIPDRPLISALITTSLRGVQVSLVLPALNNLPFVHWATRAYLWELLQHDIRVYYQPPPFVHTKLLLVDDIWSLVGSANLDPRSLRLNFELNLEVYDRELARQLSGRFDRTVAASQEITLAEVDGRSLPVKIRDAVAKLASPYL
ncbi:cardiolipin synthase, putative [Geotalea daltonii FRC-32]|uniref:Cardiolipin synthase n=1 Tax=Geotalea daltonii (strain DSM 22248 / JCM 15807 / FRC-32) TaxID=316067 RepID=B9M338_GEODF|nr:cardiolipin synthase [Geotalea daltonii]ACM19448.1 cardiolipin synthase, putative [Geotalea daltonii FRC-32]